MALNAGMKFTIAKAIEAYQGVRRWDGGPEIILMQCLADLRVYADLHGLDFGAADRAAYEMYCEVDQP